MSPRLRVIATIFAVIAFSLFTASCLQLPSLPRQPTAGVDIPASKYLFVEFFANIDATGNLQGLGVDFPGYSFDPVSGELRILPQSKTPVVLTPNNLGFFASGQSRTGKAGSGIGSTLTPIERLPHSTQVNIFSDYVGASEKFDPLSLVVQSVKNDGAIEALIGAERVTLRVGAKWERVVEKDVMAPRGAAHYKVTHVLTNFGLQDRAKVSSVTR